MELSSDLISQFVKATKDNKKVKQESTVYGTTVEYNGSIYVKLDGSDLLTPILTTTDVKPSERVTVMIKDHTATVTGNISSPAARTDDVKAVENKISEFDIIIAHKVVADDIEAINARIENLQATVGTFTNLSTNELEAINAEIENIRSKVIDTGYLSAKDIEAINADIENLRATFGKFENLSAGDLKAVNADIDYLKSYSADFTYVSTEVLEAVKASIKQLDTEKLSATDAELKYANIDFSNIGKAAIEYFYATSGLIKDVVVENGTITGHLVGVTFSGDLIEGNTIVAEKLVIKGSDGLYYKLNTDGITTEAEQTDYNSLNGSVIMAKSITAEKINVSDLVAFDATIGGFNITENALYSGVKDSVDNTTRGTYLDDTGQIAFGDGNNYIKYHRDSDGNYKLDISAESFIFSSSGKNIETTMNETNTAIMRQINESTNDLYEKYNAITKYFTFDIDGLTIGQIDNPNKIVIDNDEISILVNGNVIQKFDSFGRALIPELNITRSLNLFGYAIEQSQNGNVNCVYVGGN